MEAVNRNVPHSIAGATEEEGERWRRRCGCLSTSQRLREILERFPSPPPPTPIACATSCISAYCTHTPKSIRHHLATKQSIEPIDDSKTQSAATSKSWLVISELVHLLQLSVTTTAIALYYLIYCYMQLVYYTLRSALYFHQADGPMKITIAVVTVTSLVIGFHLIVRMERLIGNY